MPENYDVIRNMTPTDIAAYYFSKGYTPEEVNRLMESRKILFPTISDVLNKFMGRENMSVGTLAALCDINPATIYKIMGKQRNPTRNTILRMAMSLSLSFEETQVLLKSGNCSLLSASRKRDLVIMSCITQGMDYETVNSELVSRGMQDLNVRF